MCRQHPRMLSTHREQTHDSFQQHNWAGGLGSTLPFFKPRMYIMTPTRDAPVPLDLLFSLLFPKHSEMLALVDTFGSSGGKHQCLPRSCAGKCFISGCCDFSLSICERFYDPSIRELWGARSLLALLPVKHKTGNARNCPRLHSK